ncbi:Uncharacterized alpha/beta hydrolase domain [Nitrosomonas sp. Nm51]|nr:Uncharacterized alpha/beta hydrolase domain [Nitrosomonas sp. Nm51]
MTNSWGGAFGTGLEFNIFQGYEFLAREYQDGDEIYIAGFSRGAYTARSLVGLIRNCGLIDPKYLPVNAAIAYGIYRTRGDKPDSRTAAFFRSKFSRQIKIKFLGVWDTVGALGIPLDIIQEFNLEFYEFHDTKLSSIVENAYHAVALDEHRKHYDVSLWSPDKMPQQKIEQRWFVGSHSDVGGGHKDRALSDLSLRWMQDKAGAAGLDLDYAHVGNENYLGRLTDSYKEFLGGIYSHKYARNYRAVNTTQYGNETIDESVNKRRKQDRNYEPRNSGLLDSD